MQTYQQRAEAAAQHYIASQKSDPFCAARVRMHLKTKMILPTQMGQDGFYSAQPHTEERAYTNGTYMATVYRNIVRM